MAREEREMEELGVALEGVVGPRPASTLMRHLSYVPATELATKADVRAVQDDVRDLREEMREGFQAMVMAITRLESKIGVDMANLESRMVARMNAQTITLLGALATIVVAITTLAFFR